MSRLIEVPRSGFLVRFGISAAVATVVIVAIVGIGVHFHSPEPEAPESLPDIATVRVISVKDNPELARMIREARNEPVDPLRELPEPVEMPERNVQGFVQLEYTVNPDGTVSDVKVLGAAPSGVFEQRAVERVRNSMHAPAYENGEAVARRTTEILEFSVPAAELSDDN